MKLTVKQARLVAGLTQSETASRIGICTTAYARLEQNPESFTMARAVKFCEAVARSLDEINFFTP